MEKCGVEVIAIAAQSISIFPSCPPQCAALFVCSPPFEHEHASGQSSVPLLQRCAR